MKWMMLVVLAVGSAQALAEDAREATATATAFSPSKLTKAQEAALRKEVADLRAEVKRLRAELAAARADSAPEAADDSPETASVPEDEDGPGTYRIYHHGSKRPMWRDVEAKDRADAVRKAIKRRTPMNPVYDDDGKMRYGNVKKVKPGHSPTPKFGKGGHKPPQRR